MSTYIHTYTGTKMFLLDPFWPDIDLRDIAHHLSRICRYTGACKDHYSVAQHSVILSKMVPSKLAGWALMHDAAEAYLNDLSYPLKQSGAVGGFVQVEQVMMRAVWDRFQMPPFAEEPPEVKEADRYLCFLEMMQLEVGGTKHTPCRRPEGILLIPYIEPLPAEQAKILFLERALELAGVGQLQLQYVNHVEI